MKETLGGLDEFKAAPEKRSAVLIATNNDGDLFGAWNRDGASQLKGLDRTHPAKPRMDGLSQCS
jgi:hypothetical protein